MRTVQVIQEERDVVVGQLRLVELQVFDGYRVFIFFYFREVVKWLYFFQ